VTTPTTDKRALLHALLVDLAAESADLDTRVAVLDEAGWSTPTPAAGWDVRDTINHLAATDADALLALTDRAGFDALLGRLLAGRRSTSRGWSRSAGPCLPRRCWRDGAPAATRCRRRCGLLTQRSASPGSDRP